MTVICSLTTVNARVNELRGNSHSMICGTSCHLVIKIVSDCKPMNKTNMFSKQLALM